VPVRCELKFLDQVRKVFEKIKRKLYLNFRKKLLPEKNLGKEDYNKL
jgi:hypothetical protein